MVLNLMKITVPCCVKWVLAVFAGCVCAGLGRVRTMGAEEPAWIGQSNNAFAVDLYGKVAGKTAGNLFFSPFSIQTALAMTYAGARGTTAEQMAAVLHLPAESTTIPGDFGGLIKGLVSTGTDEGETGGVNLSIANALWGQAGFDFLPDFIQLLKTDYGAGIEELDFGHNAEGARQTINGWVEDQTHDKIKNLIAPGILLPSTKLVLTNAIYFKGTWVDPFNKSATELEPFHQSASAASQVNMMQAHEECGYAEGGDFQALELPYRGERLGMIVLLPSKVDGMPALEKKLTPGMLSGVFEKLRPKFRRVAVFLPRFQLTEQLELAGTLRSMGMEAAFDPAHADFSGMTGTKLLFISNVIHKAYVGVNEEGTEAAAATAVVMVGAAMPMGPPVVFRADHPFLFMIRDETSGAILFMGRVTNPG